MSYQRVPLENWAETFSTTTELSSVALGGRIVSVSDEFFAQASNLLQVNPAQSFKGQFGPRGALYSGWESRRHNPTYDWCIIKLGTSGTILGFDVDTAHFNGNEAPKVSVSALHDSSEEPQDADTRWSEILPKVNLGPNSRHLFKIPESCRANYVKLNMYPDGGIARFRVYGLVTAVWPADASESFDLAHVFAGGRVEATSDQHFGVGSNLILPGRGNRKGKDMGDGWETKRSRQSGHNDWAVIKLGAPGFLEQAEIDTANFMGNFPESCELHATLVGQDRWTQILPQTKLGPHRRHFFQLDNVQGRTYTHVKLTIHPDGGVKRVRIIGRRADGSDQAEVEGSETPISGVVQPSSRSTRLVIIPALPLTPEAFAPFGQVIQAYADNAAPRGTRITSANQGTAIKFHKLGLFESSYPPEAGAGVGLSVFRCKPLSNLEECGTSEVRVLERHPFTKQAFIPMGGGKIDGGDGSTDPGAAYLVVVAKNDAEGQPDLSTLRAFVATGAQGVMYETAVWHQPMTVLKKSMDFTCVETQIGNGDKADCEMVELDGQYKVKIPLGTAAI